MVDRIMWIKNLLGHGTQAEQDMIREAQKYARATGNEKYLIGQTQGPGHLADVLQAPGNATSAPVPTGYWKFLRESGKAGKDVSSAHAHPTEMAIPSMGDLSIWANADSPGRGYKPGVYFPADKLARQSMWITGMKGPNDTTMLPPMRYSGTGSGDYNLLRELRDLHTTFDMNAAPRAPKNYELSRHFDDYTKSWGLSPEQHAETYSSLANAALLNSTAKLTDLYMDPASRLMRGRAEQAGDVFPDWFKHLDTQGLDLTRAKGGQVPGYEAGGVPAVSLLGKNSIQWIKNLLGQGTPAEQAMVRDVREHALKTGNEKFIVGPTTAPDFKGHYATTGGPNFAPLPSGYFRFMDQWGDAGTPVSTAHSHPKGAATPSAGDMQIWANDHAWLPETTTGVFKPAARQSMWIQAARSPNDTVMIPPMQGSGVEAYDTSRAIQKLYTDRQMSRSRPINQRQMQNHFLNFLSGNLDNPQSLSHEQLNDLYNSTMKGYMFNRIGEHTPVTMDPAAAVMQGNSALQAGDVVPEFNSFLAGKGFRPFAEGGQVEDSPFPLAYASQYFDDGGQVLPAVLPGQSAIRWLSNLLGKGSDVEQSMVLDARKHAERTGNEKFLVGEREGSNILPAPLTRTGTPFSVGYPRGYNRFMQQAGQEGIPVSSAHPHPQGMALPSAGDLNVWSNYRNFPGRKSSGTLYPADKIARQRMWITGMKGEDDVAMLDAMPHVSPSDDYQKIHDLQASWRRFGNVLRDDQSMYDLRKKAADFTEDWYLRPQDQWDAFHSLNRAPLVNKLSEQAPLYIDPNMPLVKSRSDLPAGDIYPEWLKVLEQSGLDMFKAEGGQVDDFPLAYASQYLAGGGSFLGDSGYGGGEDDRPAEQRLFDMLNNERSRGDSFSIGPLSGSYTTSRSLTPQPEWMQDVPAPASHMGNISLSAGQDDWKARIGAMLRSSPDEGLSATPGVSITGGPLTLGAGLRFTNDGQPVRPTFNATANFPLFGGDASIGGSLTPGQALNLIARYSKQLDDQSEIAASFNRSMPTEGTPDNRFGVYYHRRF